MHKLAKKASVSWLSPIKARLLRSAGGGFNSDDTDECEIFYDKVNGSLNGSPMATDATILPAQLCRTMTGNLRTRMMSRFSPISERLSPSDDPQILKKLAARCYSRVYPSEGTPSFNTQDYSERQDFYNKVKPSFDRDPQDPKYWEYLLNPAPQPADKTTISNCPTKLANA